MQLHGTLNQRRSLGASGRIGFDGGAFIRLQPLAAASGLSCRRAPGSNFAPSAGRRRLRRR